MLYALLSSVVRIKIQYADGMFMCIVKVPWLRKIENRPKLIVILHISRLSSLIYVYVWCVSILRRGRRYCFAYQRSRSI